MLEAIVLGGFIGGIVRGIVGLVKHRSNKKTGPWAMFGILIFAFIGIMCALAFAATGFLFSRNVMVVVSAIAGYAGADIINSLLKVLRNRGVSI